MLLLRLSCAAPGEVPTAPVASEPWMEPGCKSPFILITFRAAPKGAKPMASGGIERGPLWLKDSCERLWERDDPWDSF